MNWESLKLYSRGWFFSFISTLFQSSSFILTKISICRRKTLTPYLRLYYLWAHSKPRHYTSIISAAHSCMRHVTRASWASSSLSRVSFWGESTSSLALGCFGSLFNIRTTRNVNAFRFLLTMWKNLLSAIHTLDYITVYSRSSINRGSLSHFSITIAAISFSVDIFCPRSIIVSYR